jgi:bacterioferritin (cytochrome b1)
MSEDMNVGEQIESLNRALRLEHRSVLQYALASGSVVSLEFQAHADRLSSFAKAELVDATRLMAKITALGGDPTTGLLRSRTRGIPGRRWSS